MWLKPAREYYTIQDDLIGVFPPEALGLKPGPDAISYMLKGRGDNVTAEPVPFRSGTFAGRLRKGALSGVVDMTGGEKG